MMKRLITLLFCLIVAPAFAATTQTITGLTAASTPDGTELLECVQGGNSRKCTINQVKTLTLLGNAATATALAANPADCSANNFATTIAANGDLTCAQPSISAGVSGLGTGVATFLGTPSSANLATALTDETGTGSVVFSASPTFTGTITAAAANFSGNVTAANLATSGTITSGSFCSAASSTSIQCTTAPAAGQILNNTAYTATPTLGASGTLGSVTMGNATSGTLTLAPVSGALGTVTVSLPAATDTLVGKATTDTLTNKTITNPAITTQALTDGATINWDMNSGNIATVTLGGNRTLAAPTNIKTGGTYAIQITQDGTGSRTLTWNSVFKWPAATAPTLSTTAARVDVVTCISFDGTNLRCSSVLDVR